jgi:hypothetical protein
MGTNVAPSTAPCGPPSTAPCGPPSTAPCGPPSTAPCGPPSTAPCGPPSTARRIGNRRLGSTGTAVHVESLWVRVSMDDAIGIRARGGPGWTSGRVHLRHRLNSLTPYLAEIDVQLAMRYARVQGEEPPGAGEVGWRSGLEKRPSVGSWQRVAMDRRPLRGGCAIGDSDARCATHAGTAARVGAQWAMRVPGHHVHCAGPVSR